MCKRKSRNVHLFQDDEEVKLNFYIFELVYILGISKRSVYRLFKKIGIKPRIEKSWHRKIFIGELLGIVRTSTFRNYIKKLKKAKLNVEIPIDDQTGMSIAKSQLHLMFEKPEDLISSKLLDIESIHLDDAIACGLLPVIKVGEEVFVNPTYLNNMYKNDFQKKK